MSAMKVLRSSVRGGRHTDLLGKVNSGAASGSTVCEYRRHHHDRSIADSSSPSSLSQLRSRTSVLSTQSRRVVTPSGMSSSTAPSNSRAYATIAGAPRGPGGPGTRVTASASGGPQAPYEYCASLVQRLDPEAWLCSYFWPKRERAWFLAWRAFNLELHLISTTITQPALAAIRFQFWRDALKAIFSQPSTPGPSSAGTSSSHIPQHPVAVLLGEMKRERPVQRYYLSQMIETRAKNLTVPPSSPTLQSHLDTHTPLSTSLLLGPLPLLLPPAHPSTASTSHTLSHLSTLLTIVSLLRTLPHLAQKRQLNIPSDLLAKHQVVEEDVFRNGAEAKGLKDALFEIGTRGMDELITARREVGRGEGREGEVKAGRRVEPKVIRPLFLSAVPAERYLKRLEQHDFNVFHPDMQKADWKLAPTIWWRYQTGKL